MADEDRIALFLDYENLALGARDHLGGMTFDLKPIADALAARGRVVVRKAYADWSFFDEDRRSLTRGQVELIELPQRMGASRKNAADIKMAVDALEFAFSRDYISTFVLCTGDSDFTPLVHKLRELNKRVIGVGVRGSTSALLPAACDEFLFYDTLEGVEPGQQTGRRGAQPEPRKNPEPVAVEEDSSEEPVDLPDLAVLIAQTLADLHRSGTEVTASLLKRTLLRKDPTFSEADYGFRAFGELLRNLADRGTVELAAGPSTGDPEVQLPERGERDAAFAVLVDTVATDGGSNVPLSGMKDQIRRTVPNFSEKAYGYRSFLQFARAAAAAGVVDLRWDEAAGDYLLSGPQTRR